MAAAPISSAPAAPPPARGEQATSRLKTKWQKYGTPALVILLALAIVFTITHNWNSWEGGRIEQITNDAYVRGDLTDRKSTRLNSSHSQISYAVFCLKKKKKHNH